AGVGDHGVTRLGKAWLEFRGDAGVQSGKNDFGSIFRPSWGNDHLGDILRNGCLQTPARRLRVGLAFGAVRGRHPRHFKPRVMLQQLDKPLPDDAGGTENTYRNFVWHKSRGSVASG